MLCNFSLPNSHFLSETDSFLYIHINWQGRFTILCTLACVYAENFWKCTVW